MFVKQITMDAPPLAQFKPLLQDQNSRTQIFKCLHHEILLASLKRDDPVAGIEKKKSFASQSNPADFMFRFVAYTI